MSLSLLTLNEFGDVSEEEFLQKQKGGPKLEFVSTGNVLGMAVENAELQSMASNALVEAADALAEEEQVRNQNMYKHMCTWAGAGTLTHLSLSWTETC